MASSLTSRREEDMSDKRDFVPCPVCGQYSHTIDEGRLAEAFMHFQTMITHPLRGHPMWYAFNEKTRDAAQVLMAAAKE